ncbi:site-specific integrase [Streptomyces sp. DT2A-34]|uniref:site-specific integrase n=1 Tax=Streptomyces sp. DT2A-34 TaxID=3051182 RepID=UPI00265C3D24|nr:site-specific integrase [Streptomyces sp. DT2A-34]MDO0909383.1 site-specific integrase [Streptomyces sp. DT2A-34]
MAGRQAPIRPLRASTAAACLKGFYLHQSALGGNEDLGKKLGTSLRLDCIGRYGGLPLLWHDQTKVGNLNAAVRIPDHLLNRLEERRQKTLAHYADHHAGRPPTPAERAHLALFPTHILNPDGRRALSYTWFHTGFRSWIAELDLGGHYVAHQARHTLATRLLRHGATLTHIRRYLGQVSDRMAEHYVHLTQSDLDNVLQHVWVAGPGTATPGEILTSRARVSVPAGSCSRRPARPQGQVSLMTWRIVAPLCGIRTARAVAVRAPSRARTSCGASAAHLPIATKLLAPVTTAEQAISSTATKG